MKYLKTIIIGLICISIIGCATVSHNQVVKQDVRDLLDQDSRTLTETGHRYIRDGDFEKALDYYLKAIQTHSGDPNVYFNIAVCYANLGEADLAGRFFKAMFQNQIGIQWLVSLEAILNRGFFSNVYESEDFQIHLREIRKMAEDHIRFSGELSHIDISKQIRYRTVLPNNFDPNKNYPILIFLHGFSGAFGSVALGWSPHTIERDIILIAPEAPYPHERPLWYGANINAASWFSIEHPWGDLHTLNMTINYLSELAKELRKKYPNSPLYLSGTSQGAQVTLLTGIRYPDLFNGLIPICGALLIPEDEPIRSQSKTKIPILKIYGLAHDTSGYETAYRRLTEAGWDVTVHTHDGGHGLPDTERFVVIDWILEQENKKYD